MNDIANAIFLVWFVGSLGVIVFRISLRLFHFMRMGLPIPSLLWRDIATMWGLAVPFFGILIFRFKGIVPQQEYGLWWVIPSGMAACIGLTIFAIFEVFVIDDKRPVLVPPEETQDQREDREFGNKRRKLEEQHTNDARAKSESDQTQR